MRSWTVIVVMIVGIGCSDFESEKEAASLLKDRPNQEGWNSMVTLSTNGVVDARIVYDHMRRWDSRQLTTFDGSLQVDFFQEGRHTAVLTADSGEIKGDNNNLSAFGRVVILSDSGLSMRTEKIYWDHQRQTIFADGFVTLTTNEDTLYGYAFESNKDLTNWRMKNAYGQTGRDIDLKTGTVRRARPAGTQDKELEKEMERVLKGKQ